MIHHATRRTVTALFILALAAFSLNITARAQEKPTKSWKDYSAELHTTDCRRMPTVVLSHDCERDNAQTRFIYLNNMSQQNDANEILVALRNSLDPSTKIFLVASQNAIALTTYPEEFARAEVIVRALDRPHKAYRLTYTIAESDAGKRIGVQHFSLTTVIGQRTQMKEGSKVPVATGSYSTSDKTSQEQFTYLDVGMNFDASITQNGDNLLLKTHVEQSAVANTQTISNVQEPVIRQSVFDGVAAITPGKPVTIGAIDIPGSTRHLDIEVLAEPLQ
jgi:type II secretory pathway component GspD/PulD (secretin)